MAKSNPSLPREIEVQVDGTKVTVRKLPLGRVAQLASLLDALPDVIAEVTEDNETRAVFDQIARGGEEDFAGIGQAVVRLLPRLLAVAQDFVVRLIVVGAELDRKWVEEHVGLDEALELLTAIFTVNNLSAIQRHAKNLIGLFGLDGKKLAQQAAQRARKQTKEPALVQ